MEYEAVIALEIHAHLKTARKQYCDCPVVNTRELAEANRYVCPVCLGHPGVLPVLNRESVVLAMKSRGTASSPASITSTPTCPRATR
jgi:aspartyl-tRNA(Asn)/glutamyl-tRNA(Gln) amidotransferase subunit B